MNRSSCKVQLFALPRDYLLFMETLAEGLALWPVELLAFCVMPNHWHLVVRVECTHDLSRFMHWLTTTHAHRTRRRTGTVGFGPVYKGRFLAVGLETEIDVVRVCRYVERNPLRAGFVRAAQDWPWSSLADRNRQRRRVPTVSAPFLESAAWADFVNAAQTGSELAAMDRFERVADGTPPPTLPVRLR
jgi:putative transposase